ncbi:MAG: hypothetical protein HZB26_14255, partial [Candidatus Hydrogenedentes bacterium]|nr:hypothetical protein [Candidatus Hydrogenedentota bacterium]
MALNARHRYILWNAGLWLLLAAAGVVSIGLLRQYGSAVAQQERARALVARADAYYQDGDLASCQGVLVQALTLSPGLLSEVADRFGMRMANLPFSVDGLTAKTSAPVAPASPEALASAQLDIVRGNLDQASRLLDQYTANGGRDSRAFLWRGRIALEAADFPKAQHEFARYWQAVPDAKANFDKELGGRADATDPEQRAQD